MKALGIDIGEDSIKIAEVAQNKKHITVTAVYEKKFSPEISEHDREIEAIEYIRLITSKLDPESKRIVMALKQDKVTVRRKQFPFSDRVKILKSLSFEMEEDIPFDPDLCLFDAKTILTEGFGAHVLAVAAPKSQIEKTLNLSKDFGFDPSLLTVDGLALTNLLEDWEAAPPQYPTATGPLSYNPSEEKIDDSVPLNQIQITLNIGHKKTLLCAQIENRVVFVRSLMWGGDQLIQELVRKFQLPYLEAQRMLQTDASLLLSKSGESFETTNIANTLEKSLREFIRDLQMSFLEIQSEFHGQIQNIYLTGGLSQLPNLGAYLTQHLEVSCNAVSLVDQYVDAQHIQAHGISLGDVRSRFATAIGIALEAFKKPRNPSLQFIKGEFASDNNKFKQFWNDWGNTAYVGLSAIIILFVWGFFRTDFSTVLVEKGDEALKKQAKTVAQLPNKRANEKGVKNYIKENKKLNQEYKLLNKVVGMNSALDVLKKISESSPSKAQAKIDIVELQITDDLVKMVGYANSPREVDLIAQNLTQISLDKKITQETPSLPSQANRVAFSMSFRTDRGIAK